MKSSAVHTGERCRELAIDVSDYLDGELSVTRAERLERHLAGCECCAAFAESLRRAIATCRAAGRTALPRTVQARARRRVRELLGTEARGRT